ncbi:hypothetical protein CCP3SC15_2320007 [Gammaproteobacteria bacterium]
MGEKLWRMRMVRIYHLIRFPSERTLKIPPNAGRAGVYGDPLTPSSASSLKDAVTTQNFSRKQKPVL